MTTFSCGIEEPLQENGQLYALDEGTGSIVLAEFSSAELNRYSFLPDDNSNCEQSLASLVSRIAAASGVIATWLVTFRASPAGSAMRARALATRLAKRGWHVLKLGGDVHVATRGTGLAIQKRLSPADADPLICGWFLLLGPRPEDELLLSKETAASLRSLALTHRLQPSRQFLTACGASDLTVAYLAKSATERSGLVVASPAQLGFTVRSMQREGVVQTVLLGNEAANVWRA